MPLIGSIPPEEIHSIERAFGLKEETPLTEKKISDLAQKNIWVRDVFGSGHQAQYQVTITSPRSWYSFFGKINDLILEKIFGYKKLSMDDLQEIQETLQEEDGGVNEQLRKIITIKIMNRPNDQKQVQRPSLMEGSDFDGGPAKEELKAWNAEQKKITAQSLDPDDFDLSEGMKELADWKRQQDLKQPKAEP
jgi:hypothetical protein